MATNSSAWPASRPRRRHHRQARREPYCSGRGDWWQKITCKRRDSFVVVGFEPSTVPGHLGGLLLAARKGEEVAYVGGCGTGGTVRNSVRWADFIS
ncbi:hypothetical protein [Sinorhizobium medicae]|uniref:hypothetical protein n=1 Tax=Sinorhizobium medicae TaxID=110321 RepID=UPI0004894768